MIIKQLVLFLFMHRYFCHSRCHSHWPPSPCIFPDQCCCSTVSWRERTVLPKCLIGIHLDDCIICLVFKKQFLYVFSLVSNCTLMLWLSVSIIARRSIPRPQPAVGGSPYSSAVQKFSSISCASSSPVSFAYKLID